MRFSVIFLELEPHFFLNGGTSQNSAVANAKYRCYRKTFHSSLESWPLLCSNMADPMWPVLEVFNNFLILTFIFFQMVEQAKILPLQKRNMDVIPKLFILRLRADLCCGQYCGSNMAKNQGFSHWSPFLTLITHEAIQC